MGYQRKKYHSGLTYQQECELCHTVVRYTDKILGFRPWYADGFVYCPTCEKPLRHNEKYAIDPETGEYLNLNGPTVVSNTKTSSSAPSDNPGKSLAKFCSECGRKFEEGEKFCPECGKVR